MSSVIFLVLLALCAVMYGDAYPDLNKRYTKIETVTLRIPSAQPCYVKGQFYAHGDSTGDPCDRCFCSNGHQICYRMGCNIDGVEIDPYSD